MFYKRFLCCVIGQLCATNHVLLVCKVIQQSVTRTRTCKTCGVRLYLGMASDGVNNVKSKGRNNDPTPQTITLTFVPETDHYERPKNMEEHIRTYFESINGIGKRIIAEERKIIAQNRNTWPTLPVEERDKLLNDRMITSDVRQKYNSTDEYWLERTPWQAEKLMIGVDKPSIRDDRTDSMSIKDSFSRPFQWATKSQRNICFPELKRERLKNIDKIQETTKAKPRGAIAVEDQTVKKLNNVEKSVQEKQIKTKNDNIKDVNGETDVPVPVCTKQEDSSPEPLKKNSEHVEDEGEASSEQPKADEKEYLDGTKNIFEFLQSWDP